MGCPRGAGAGAYCVRVGPSRTAGWRTGWRKPLLGV